MIKKNNCKKSPTDNPFSVNHFFFNLRYVLSTLALLLGLQYLALGNVESSSMLKDSTLESINKSSNVIDVSTIVLTSLERVSIATSPLVFSVTATILNATCTPTNNGSIDVTVNGGVAPYSFLWSNGSITEDISNLVSGTYTLTITDDDGNIIEKGFQVKRACLEVEKKLDSEPINNGDSTYTLSYTIKIYNAGDIDLTQVMVIDNLTYTFQEGSFFYKPEVISQRFVVNQVFDGIEDFNLNTETFDILGPGGIGYITFSVRVKPRNKDEVYTNIATFYAYDSSGMFISGESSTATVTFSDRPEIQLTKVAQESSYGQPSDLINYAITVVNSGNVTLTNVTVTDPLTGLNEVIPVLGVGASNIILTVYTVTQLDIDAGLVTNTVTATGTFSSTIISAVDTEEVPASQQPLISVVKNAVDTTYNQVGNLANFDILVTNTGNVTLTDVLVEDSLTNFSQIISTLAVNQTITLTTTYTVTQADLDAGLIINTATATTEFGTSKVTDSDDDTLYGLQLPGLAILKKARPIVFKRLGEIIIYDISVTNTGNVTLTDVLVEDSLTNFSNIISTLAVNQTITLTTTYTVTQADLDAGLIINTATATTEFGTTKVTDSDDEILLGLKLPGINVIKTARKNTFNQSGQIITYDISVTNTGNVTLTNVLVTDPLTALSQTISSLGASNTYTITTTYGVTQANLDAGFVTNTATASSTYSTTLLTDSDDETVLGLRQPALSIIKTARKNTFNKKDEIVYYDIVVRNTGNVTLYNVAVTDPLTGLTRTISSLEVGAFNLITTDYSITQIDILAKVVNNTATASGIFYGQQLIVSDEELIVSSQKPPIAVDDINTTLISVKVSGNVLPNDSDPDGDPLTVTQFVISGKTYTAGSTAVISGVGTIVLNSNGSYTFTPFPTYVGQVPLIRYTITDGNENFASANLKIVVIPLANPPQLLVNDTSICENEIAILNAGSINVQNPVYTWFTDSTTTNQVFVGASFITPILSQTTYYYVRLSGSNLLPALPLIVKKVTVNVIPLPTKPIVTLTGKSILCPGDSTTLISSLAMGYQWYKNGVVIVGANQRSITVKEIGDYTVRTFGENNCMSKPSEVFSISIASIPPSPTIVSDRAIYCLGDTARITSSLASVNLWYRNGIQLLSDSGKSIKTTLPGTYTVIHKTVNACYTSVSNAIALTFNVLPSKPNVIIDGPLIFCEGDYRILKTIIPQGASVQWYKDGVLMDGKTKDTLRITVAGKYTAQFINTTGCTSPFSDCICTEIKCETDIYTPDIFTPNDDDINDVIKPYIPGIRKFVCFKVYNRWGNLIFYTTDPYKGWDGKYKGSIQPAETYMWIVEGFDSSGKKIKKSGMLSLMR